MPRVYPTEMVLASVEGSTKLDWRQSKNGGWIHKTAEVDDSAIIAKNTIICDHVIIEGDVFVDDHTLVRSWSIIGIGSTIGCRTMIGHGSRIGYFSIVGHCVFIGGHVTIGNSVFLGEAAEIDHDTHIPDYSIIGRCAKMSPKISWEKPPLYINGSEHPLTHSGPNLLSIGCLVYLIDFWLKKYKRIGKEKGYSNKQIIEYKRYIELFAIADAETFQKRND